MGTYGIGGDCQPVDSVGDACPLPYKESMDRCNGLDTTVSYSADFAILHSCCKQLLDKMTHKLSLFIPAILSRLLCEASVPFVPLKNEVSLLSRSTMQVLIKLQASSFSKVTQLCLKE
jgi:hypothetical protein